MVRGFDHDAPQLQDNPGQAGQAPRNKQQHGPWPERDLCGALQDWHLQSEGGSQPATARQVGGERSNLG